MSAPTSPATTGNWPAISRRWAVHREKVEAKLAHQRRGLRIGQGDHGTPGPAHAQGPPDTGLLAGPAAAPQPRAEHPGRDRLSKNATVKASGGGYADWVAVCNNVVGQYGLATQRGAGDRPRPAGKPTNSPKRPEPKPTRADTPRHPPTSSSSRPFRRIPSGRGSSPAGGRRGQTGP